MLDPSYAPGYESSGTALFTYGYLWGFNNGILSEKEYGATVQKAWNYLTTVALQDDGAVGYMQPIGEKADPNQTVGRGSVADFGVGAFLLAASEMARYAVGDASIPSLRLSSVRLTEPNLITVVFNDVPDPAEVLNVAHYTLNGKPVEAVVGTDGDRTAVLTLAHALDFGRYTLGIEGLNSAAGGQMVGMQSRTLLHTVPLTPSPAGIKVTAIGNQSGNTPANTIDNKLSTRWSKEGTGQWIRYDLGEVKPVEAVDLAFYAGTQRKSYFDIEVSEDGVNYTTVLPGCASSGLTDEMERYAFDSPQAARYVRVVCNGNSQGGENWNSITEARIRVTEVTMDGLTLPGEVYADILLPAATANGNPVVWSSSAPEVLSGYGFVTPGEEPVDVTLTATAGLQEKSFEVTVMPRTPEKTLRLFYAFDADDCYLQGTARWLTDRSGCGHDARIMGKAVVEGSLDLTANTATGFGTNGYLLLPKGLLDSLRSYTVMFTAVPSALDKLPRFYDFGASSAHSLFLRGGTFGAGVKYNGASTVLLNANRQPMVGQEQHIAVTFEARSHTTCIYLNGEKVAEGTTLAYEPYELARFKADTRNYIGRTQWWDSNVKNDNPDYCGTMDNFRIYGLALTAEEMQAVFEGDATPVGQVRTEAGFALRNSVVRSDQPLELLCGGDAPAGCTVELVGVSGARLCCWPVTGFSTSFPADVPAGIYLVRVSDGGRTLFTAKLLVQ